MQVEVTIIVNGQSRTMSGNLKNNWLVLEERQPRGTELKIEIPGNGGPQSYVVVGVPCKINNGKFQHQVEIGTTVPEKPTGVVRMTVVGKK